MLVLRLFLEHRVLRLSRRFFIRLTPRLSFFLSLLHPILKDEIVYFVQLPHLLFLNNFYFIIYFHLLFFIFFILECQNLKYQNIYFCYPKHYEFLLILQECEFKLDLLTLKAVRLNNRVSWHQTNWCFYHFHSLRILLLPIQVLVLLK